MKSTSIEAGLKTVEDRLAAVSAALVLGDAPQLESHSRQLRQAMADFALLGGAAPSAAMRERLAQVSQTLARQREQIVRRAVVVERTLATLIPQADTGATYTQAVGRAPGAGSVARIYNNRAR